MSAGLVVPVRFLYSWHGPSGSQLAVDMVIRAVFRKICHQAKKAFEYLEPAGYQGYHDQTRCV